MIIRKLLLASLLTVSGILSLVAQTNIHVFGVVVNANGGGQQDVAVNVSVFYADSTFFLESSLTDEFGDYEVFLPNPDPNVLGFVQVDMVDCNNNIQTQVFTAFQGAFEFEANFTYCQQNNPDSCVLFILSESNPGTNLFDLTAWTPPGIPVDYLWSTGETTQSIYQVGPGTYCVTATIAPLGCTLTDCITLTSDSTGFCFAYIVSTQNSDSTYNLEVVPTGMAPFTYAWTTGETTQNLQNVAPGTYCVVVTDATGCAYTTCIIVDNVNFCEVYISADPNGGLTAYGFGLPPVSYLWSTGETTQSIFPQIEGLYCVTATDANGCEAYSCYDYWWSQDSCFAYVVPFLEDSTTFALQAYYSGFGINPIYTWNTGETTSIIYPTDPFQSYCVTVTDETGCVATGCYEPSNWCYAWVSLLYVDTTTAVLTAMTDPIFNWPGAPASNYVWSTGETTSSISVDSSGYYCVTVSIGSVCTSVACVEVDFESCSTQCSAWVVTYPDSNGSQWYAEVFAWGVGTFSYEWSTGDTTSVIPIDYANQFECVTVTSSFGCETVACVDTFFNPCKSIISATYFPDSIAVLTATTWNPGQNPTFLWSNGETGAVITVNTPGLYCVTVSGSGCTSEACIEVYFGNNGNCGVYITEFDTIAGTIIFANPWGTPPFQYLWDNGSTDSYLWIDFGTLEHCVTVTDATGCVSTACNYKQDSCYAEIIYSPFPTPQLQLVTWDPVWWVQWSTSPQDSSLWLNIDAPGTYCAVFATINGCFDTLCITIDSLNPNNGINAIGGYVFADSVATIHGTVNAYRINNNTGEIFEKAGSGQIGQDGYYYIDGLQPGIYVVKAELSPNSPEVEHYIPTYHLSSASWETADPHLLPNLLPVTTDIYLIRQRAMSGSGVIGGILYDPQHLTAGAEEESRGEDGVGSVVILLFDVNGTPLQYEVSLEDGSFRFVDLPLGTYRIKFDIPGIVSPDVWVTLTSEAPEVLNLNIIVEGETVAVKDPVSEEIRLYPNPASAEVNMAVPGEDVPYAIQVVDMQGKVLYAGSARNDKGILSVSIYDLPNGLYHVNLVSENHLYYGRFVKQE